MSWLSEFRADVARYTAYTENGAAQNVVSQQALWALLQYRLASATYRSTLPPALRRSLLVVLYVWRKLIEMTTGISLPHTAIIGKGLYIAHFGHIIVNNRARVGEHCDLHQGVTIAYSDRAGRAGVPVIGDRVWIGPNATIAGPITVGDHAMISANTLVVWNVPPDTVVRGVPAEIVGSR